MGGDLEPNGGQDGCNETERILLDHLTSQRPMEFDERQQHAWDPSGLVTRPEAPAPCSNNAFTAASTGSAIFPPEMLSVDDICNNLSGNNVGVLSSPMLQVSQQP